MTNKLRGRGCIIADDSFCESILVNIGYYRLSAYFLPVKNTDGKYVDNLSFEKVYHRRVTGTGFLSHYLKQ